MYDTMNKEVESAKLVDEISEVFNCRRIMFRFVIAKTDMMPGGIRGGEAIQSTSKG